MTFEASIFSITNPEISFIYKDSPGVTKSSVDAYRNIKTEKKSKKKKRKTSEMKPFFPLAVAAAAASAKKP